MGLLGGGCVVVVVVIDCCGDVDCFGLFVGWL